MQQRYREDLEEFLRLTKLPRGPLNDKDFPNEYWHLNFYQSHSLEELRRFIDGLQLKEKVLDDYTFNYYMNVIIKYMNGTLDSHTSLAYSKITTLPYRLKWIDDSGLFVDYSVDKMIRKAKIIKINGVLIERLIYEYEKMVSYATKSHLYARLERDFQCLEVLYSLPSFQRKDLFLEIETDKGLLTIDGKNKYTLEVPEEKPDFYIRDKALIFRYQNCHPYYIPVITNLIKTLDREIENQNITKFILDLRNNGGGASGIIKPLIEYLKDKDLELVTIVNKGVFSSGRFAAVDMQRLGSKLVGEQIGTPINCFGNVLKPSVLKNTKEQPIFSKTYWYLDEEKKKMVGIYTREKLQEYPKEFLKPKFLRLDEEYKETVEDFINDYDTFLEKAINNLHKRI